jgi:NADP-dependent 3-hydroxy acid dehydrogenase YdfG|tara:strand:- start:7595 stop:7900 length:306 start_codon:yes stop_codon:yes gene_type:complete
MSFAYKHVLLIGATSGIGKAMADQFIGQGVKVTVVGRRQQRLDDFIAQHGGDKASGFAFDIEKVHEIPSFIEKSVFLPRLKGNSSHIVVRSRPSQQSTASS